MSNFSASAQQIVDGHSQIVQVVAVVGQITEDAEVARTKNFRSREGQSVHLARRPIPQFEAKLIASGSRYPARRAPFQEWRADARHREPGGPHALRRVSELFARQRQHVATIDDAQIDRADAFLAGEGKSLVE